ncbi:hypothetical protein [Herbaspirillum huttiense]|uniref:hypothetical protein n=1 Tax=Herbaspirillum huttiense TaxID=863372 RepID=UPI00034D3DCC|nr:MULTISPECIES: hypothetical protein [Herbaspirillum]UWE16636.1 hypothetical protein NY669_00235 [Herbaspirillum huttiense]
MNARLPACLQLLGLDADADERSVRKAYARELKLLDQQQQPDQFQVLHEAYQAALSWCRAPRPQADDLDPVQSDAEQAEPVSAPSPLEPPPPPVRPSYAQHHARLLIPRDVPVFTAVDVTPWHERAATHWSVVRGRFRALAAAPDGDDAAGWTQLLNELLSQEQWQELRARPWLEQQIADLLADGWRPGHHHLFEAAAEVFHWHQDVVRLKALGEAGKTLGLALDQKHHFDHYASSQNQTRPRAIARLRNPRPPQPHEIEQLMWSLQPLVQRYPQWMNVVTSMVNYQQWNESGQPSSPTDESDASFDRTLERRHQIAVWCGVLVFLLIASFALATGWTVAHEEPAHKSRAPFGELEAIGQQFLKP